MVDLATELENMKPVLENLPTGKPHISFSELREWQNCSFKHKLKFVRHIDLGEPGALMEFGTAVHSSCEKFIKTGVMDPKHAIDHIEKKWPDLNKFKGFEPEKMPAFLQEARDILADVPTFMNETFPGWEAVDAEHYLYEPIEGFPKNAFKGFIDAVIKVKDKHGREVFWLIDWKSTGWGWHKMKKGDPQIHSQLVLYKNYWSKKTCTDPKLVRCGFVLLKRSAKPGKHCELVKVSVGPVTNGRALKVVNSMISSVKRGFAVKNRNSCTYCEFKNTQHCP